MRTRPFRIGRTTLAALLLGAALPVTVLAQEPAPTTHTVKKGDTLWDIAGLYLKDPFLWPEIYRINTDVVEDPHWIYPGEALRIQPGADVAAVPPGPEAEAAMPVVPAPADTVMVQSDADAQAAAAAAAAAAAQGQGAGAGQVGDDVDMSPLFGRRVADSMSIKGYVDRPYRPLRRGEFHSAGFLTEGRDMPYGSIRGNVLPSELPAALRSPGLQLHARMGVRPPSGGAYQVGDSLLTVQVREGFGGFGDIVVPTGVVVVREVNDPEAVAEVIEVYGAIQAGDKTLPLEPFTPGPETRAVPVEAGLEARVIGDRDGEPFKGTQDVLFLDRGAQDGVARGDVFEVSREARDRSPQADTVDDQLLLIQVVRTGEHTSTAKVLGVGYPRVVSGSVAKQVAKLPS